MGSLGVTQRKYWVYLCKCMGYHLHGDINHFDPYTQPMFEVDVLGTLTPKSLERWMHLSAFGVPDPARGMASMNGRSSSVEFMKKAVSSFMPNKLQGWNAITNCGNPTKSLEVNNLIKLMKKNEVRKVGKKSHARRALVKPEFRLTLRMLEGEGLFDTKYRYTCMLRQQFQFIGRGDDVCHLEREGLRHHPDFDFALSQKVEWSKNVLEAACRYSCGNNGKGGW